MKVLRHKDVSDNLETEPGTQLAESLNEVLTEAVGTRELLPTIGAGGDEVEVATRIEPAQRGHEVILA
jgi:hypothetical protein